MKKVLILSAAVLSVVALTACQAQNAGTSEEIQLIQSAEDDKDGDFFDYVLNEEITLVLPVEYDGRLAVEPYEWAERTCYNLYLPKVRETSEYPGIVGYIEKHSELYADEEDFKNNAEHFCVDYYLKSVSDGTYILSMSSSQQTDEANYEEFRELESYLKLISAK